MKVVVKYSFVQSFILDASNGKVSSALSSRDFPRGYLVNIVLLTVPLPPLQISRQRGGCAKHGELRHHMRDSLPRSTCMEQAARLRDSNSCRCMTSALIFHVLASNVLHAVSVRRNSLIVVQSVRCNAAASGASCESPCVCLPTSALKDLVSDCTIHSNLEVDRNRSLASGPEHAMMTTVFQSSTPPPLAPPVLVQILVALRDRRLPFHVQFGSAHSRGGHKRGSELPDLGLAKRNTTLLRGPSLSFVPHQSAIPRRSALIYTWPSPID